ncbi:S4 domain-containing protein YaaA [Paenactinomyces guangxiensis]|uniref:S4 domain-containing protein YaaA n=1 Tax=Paenactinomyces guangxiensis TaxID=1490290 RepID=A0A7W2A8R6_9BACL|nr:S4 domain-containing protein YaaA [Paenactinomyces guangxiensis]MBA4494118.1 S4 domain-containing protein YaaA [Paenactinomyces guangxiensis]MBH8591137.1 S4 domain-containing protein YaaA [Paenactinomyces guangxiensis]
MQQFKINGPFITLGQLLKRIDLIDSGGQAKHFLQEIEVKVNDEVEWRRGRKIYPQDIVDIAGHAVVQVVQG